MMSLMQLQLAQLPRQIAPYFRLNVFAEGCFSGATDKV
jgi:hypothetical protein